MALYDIHITILQLTIRLNIVIYFLAQLQSELLNEKLCKMFISSIVHQTSTLIKILQLTFVTQSARLVSVPGCKKHLWNVSLTNAVKSGQKSMLLHLSCTTHQLASIKSTQMPLFTDTT